MCSSKSTVSSAIAAAVADGSADFGILSELPLIEGLSTSAVSQRRAGRSCCKRVIRSRQRQSLHFAEIADQPFVG
jgi:hypothetical protein